MDFIEGRIDLDAGQLGWLAELLRELNATARTVFARSISKKVPVKGVAEPWAEGAGCFLDGKGADRMLTSHQKDMAVRNARGLRRTCNAKAERLSGHHAKIARSCSEAIGRMRGELAKLSAKPVPFSRRGAHSKRAKAAEGKKLAIQMKTSRMQRLNSSSRRWAALADSGLASMAFGGRRLASQVNRLGEPDSPFESKAEWTQAWHEARGQAWHEARGQAWLFEGHKAAPGANDEVKIDLEDGILRARLTDRQAEARMALRAQALGVPLATLMAGKSDKWSAERMGCRYLCLKLDLSGQPIRLSQLAAALTPSDDPKYRGKTPPCEAPVSWRIRIEGDPAKPAQCKAYARATWKIKEVPVITSPANGCLGVDVNAWGVSIALCSADGNKPAKGEAFAVDRPIAWHGSSGEALHEIRIFAKEIVESALALGVPLALELLDFSDLKSRLREEARGERSRRLSSFAYQKLLDAIVARAAKMGVEVRWVDPAWTSIVGWAKYGSRLGLSPDQAAAFQIARTGVLSKMAKSHLRVAKRNGAPVLLHGRQERLDGLSCSAGLASKGPVPKAEDPIDLSLKKCDLNGSEEGQPASTRTEPGRRRSAPARERSTERRLSEILGGDRRTWAGKLRAASARGEAPKAASPPPASAAGQARRAAPGDASLPANLLDPGPGRISTG